MTLNGMKIKLKSKAYWNRVRRILDESTLGIVNIVKSKQRLTDIELQRWLSEISNDTRKLANQSNKMRTYCLFKTTDNYKCEDYLHRVTNTRHRLTLPKLQLRNHKLRTSVFFC